jgi:DNA (cytosine-5)-methyltransferase 1
MKKVNFKKAKDKVVKYCQRYFPKFALDSEFNAIVTHWLFEPAIRPPLMPEDIFIKCQQLFAGKNAEGKHHSDAVREEYASYQTRFNFCYEDIQFPPPENPAFSFIDLFAGIGGFRLAMQGLGGKCVFSSEWDGFAQATYEANFGEVPYGDIRKVDKNAIPGHDVLCAGFPCQPFSLAGVSKKNSLGRKHGFEDKTQGTLFFEIKEILAIKHPKAFFLENVKNLHSHDEGKTFEVILHALKDVLGYVVNWQIVDGGKWVPQHRERLFIVGYDPKQINISENEIIIPLKPEKDYRYTEFKDIISPNVEGYTLGSGTWDTLERHKAHHAEAGNGFGYSLHKLPIKSGAISRTISARYHKDGAEILIEQPGNRPRRLTVEEAMQLQGYNPNKFKFPVSKTQAYKQIGNSVVVPAIQACASEIAKVIKEKTK